MKLLTYLFQILYGSAGKKFLNIVYDCASFVACFPNMSSSSILGLCDMDQKYISRFFYFFFDFDFNHDFDTNRHALSHILLVFAHLTCFCISYLSCTSCFALFFILLHILLFISCFYLYIRGVATGVPGCAGATHSGSWHT